LHIDLTGAAHDPLAKKANLGRGLIGLLKTFIVFKFTKAQIP